MCSAWYTLQPPQWYPIELPLTHLPRQQRMDMAERERPTPWADPESGVSFSYLTNCMAPEPWHSVRLDQVSKSCTPA